jgi:uncharacterized protein (TIGR01777 family)
VRLIVAGSSGLIGSALVAAARAGGHRVTRLVRRPARTADEVSWDPGRRSLDPAALDGVEAIVNLSGAGVGARRWTEAYKRTLRSSRIDPTATLVAGIRAAAQPPRVFLSGSAIGAYGDRGEDVVDEGAPYGEGFLAGLVRDWEATALGAEQAGCRVVCLRTGLVLAGSGGLLGQLVPLFRLGLGGRLGSGRQWMSWIALADEISAIMFLLGRGGGDGVRGPVNLTAPAPVRNAEFTAALGRELHRPAVLPVPAAALRLALGPFADEGALVSQRAEPRVLQRAGFRFHYPRLAAALAAALGAAR